MDVDQHGSEQIKVVSLHRQRSAEVLCLYHHGYVLISLQHKNFGQVTKINMQDRR